MKKLLLSTVALSGLAFVATPAQAQVELSIGGYFKGYAGYVDQDTTAATDVRTVDFFKDTELDFTGETTLDNGMTVGVLVKMDVDGADNTTTLIDESYAYFSNNWGRVNFGEEDGAAYLLQVSAPSADSNVDGLRTYISAVNYDAMDGVATANGDRLSYDMVQSDKDTKFTYLTPVINGFQVGASYTPDDGQQNGRSGVRLKDVVSAAGQILEVAARYEGMVNNVGFAIGAGFAQQELEENAAVAAGVRTDDTQEWNIGADFDIGAFGFGVAYYSNDYGDTRNAGNTGNIDSEEVTVIGVDYTTGAFKLGASYYDAEQIGGNDGEDAKRLTGGVVYSYGPGMTLRGSLSQVGMELDNADDQDATQLLIGTQIKF